MLYKYLTSYLANLAMAFDVRIIRIDTVQLL